MSDLEKRRKAALEAAREIKASRRRDRQDREVLTTRLQQLAAKQFDCDPEQIEVSFSGGGMEPIVYVPVEKGVKLAHRLRD